MKSAEYYLNQAAMMADLAEKAVGKDTRKGFLKAVEAYRALAESAVKLQGKDPAPDME